MNKSFNVLKEGSEVWLTPPYILEALGKFDLDPCSPIERPWNTARKHYTIIDNGLIKPWAGRVWCNPPYGNKTESWLSRLAEHDNGIALIFARTDTRNFFNNVWARAKAIMFLKGRVIFYNGGGKKAYTDGGAPSCLIAYGDNNVKALYESGLEGKILEIQAEESGPQGSFING